MYIILVSEEIFSVKYFSRNAHMNIFYVHIDKFENKLKHLGFEPEAVQML